jgi:hypothetical protein
MIFAMTAALETARRRIPDLWRHLGLIITMLAGAIVLIRLLAAPEWDQQLAMAILQVGGTGNVLVGAVRCQPSRMYSACRWCCWPGECRISCSVGDDQAFGMSRSPYRSSW